MDYGHKRADKMLKDLEKRIEKEYRQAAKDVEKSMNKYLERYKVNDDKMRKLLSSGSISNKEYTDWRKKQILLSKKWKYQREDLAKMYANKGNAVNKLISEHKMEVYAMNFNYGVYEIESKLKINTMFTLYDRNTVARLLKDDPQLLPLPGKKTSEKIRQGKLVKWNERQIQSVMTQGIVQGESIPKISKRLATTVSESNMKDAIRNARTMTTGAENAGRLESYMQAEELGIKMGKTWLAVHDARTRKSHRALDGETVPIKETFSNDLMYPGEPTGDPAEVYNCRCTMVSDILSVDGVDLSKYKEDKWSDNFGVDYESWKKAHK